MSQTIEGATREGTKLIASQVSSKGGFGHYEREPSIAFGVSSRLHDAEKNLHSQFGGLEKQQANEDEPSWFDATDNVRQGEPDAGVSDESQNWTDADGKLYYYLKDPMTENDQVDADFLFPAAIHTAGMMPLATSCSARPTAHAGLDDSYDVISEGDVATLNTGSGTREDFNVGPRARTLGGLIPSSSKMLKRIMGLNEDGSYRAESRKENYAPGRSNQTNNPDNKSSFPIPEFLKKHLTAPSARNAVQRRALQANSGGSPGALRRRGPLKEVDVPFGSGLPNQYYPSVASNSIVFQSMSPDLHSAGRTSVNMHPPSTFPERVATANFGRDRVTFSRESEARTSGGRPSASHNLAGKTSESLDENPSTNPGDAVKVRLQSIWNNVKYGWTVHPRMSFSKQQPLWLLGECHNLTDERELVPNTTGGSTLQLSGIDKFRQDFMSRLWFTYRRDFARLPKEAAVSAVQRTGASAHNPASLYPPLPGSGGTDAAHMPSSSASTSSSTGGEQREFSTDCGWGCMLRSGQMLLAQALVNHFLGRQWRWQPTTPSQNHEQSEQDFVHRQIIRWCSDNPDSPFSLHSLVKVGHDLGRKAGDWFGPATLAVLMKKALINVHYAERLAPNLLAAMSPQSICRLQQLQIYVARDSTVYTTEIDELCTRGYITGDIDYETVRPPTGFNTSRAAEEWKYSLVMFVPALLGASRLNKMYIHCIEEFLTLSHCCGIIGGRPRHSLYFVGYQTPYLIYLDPHYCQKAVATSPSLGTDQSADAGQAAFPLESFHCCSPRKMPYNKLDPSCTIGFYVRNRHEFQALRTQLTDIQKNVCQKYPIFSFSDQPVVERKSGNHQKAGEASPRTAVGAETMSAPLNTQPSRTFRGRDGRLVEPRIDDGTEIDAGFVVL